MNREEYEKKLRDERGQKYLDENKGLLDAQWKYIESLGDIDDIDNSVVSDLIISKGNQGPTGRDDLIIFKAE